ncbi:cyclopropane-fatty-acyl-phospholipid synthase [Amylocystis lapponica]|nr:cyclopropane-fatty-acyl-phospholipid synthase [Amylocystis lapponica]
MPSQSCPAATDVPPRSIKALRSLALGICAIKGPSHRRLLLTNIHTAFKMGRPASTSPSSVLSTDPKEFSLVVLWDKPRPHKSSLARSSIHAVLQRGINRGCLHIHDSEGTHIYGQVGVHPIHLTVHSERFWKRVFTSGDLGFSEAYMMGEIEVDDLKGMMGLWLDNQAGLSGIAAVFSRVASALSGLANAFFGQTRSQARLNASISYNQSNELFRAFLSEEMTYSCALWSDEEGGVRGDIERGPTSKDLEMAQRRKIHHVLCKARVKPGDRILEFGTGWGALAIEAARTYGCEVDTLTLSESQADLARTRVAAAGLQGRVRVHLLDYRALPAHFAGAFDALVSIEMLEHVGAKHYKTYFHLVDWALKPRGATAVVSSTTFPESRYTAYQADDFMRRYMWPNSSLPSAAVLISAAGAASRGRLSLDSVENHSAHYPRTLRTWGRRLAANAPPGMSPAALRKWEYLFAYAGAGFARGYITCHMLTFVREGDVSEPCD